MSLHEKWLKLAQEADNNKSSLYEDIPEVSMRLMVTAEGMKIETRSPSGSGDIVHHMYLTTKQAYYLRNYIERVFID